LQGTKKKYQTYMHPHICTYTKRYMLKCICTHTWFVSTDMHGQAYTLLLPLPHTLKNHFIFCHSVTPARSQQSFLVSLLQSYLHECLMELFFFGNYFKVICSLGRVFALNNI
jgi:hypothetical protein